MKLLKRGAEAELLETEYLGRKALLKKRVPKAYRQKALDEKIRLERTRQEASLLHKAKEAGIRAPVIYKIDKKNFAITMELVEGKRLKDALCKKNYKAFCKSIGSAVAQMHLAGIIHGDLTTSNILLNNRKALVFVDFGLGFFSQKLEDKAVDLLVFKKTFEATHCRLSSGWKAIIESYCLNSHEGKAVVGQIASVEARGRYL